MSGAKRGAIGMDFVNDELRIAYLKEADEKEAIEMAQLEWAPCMHIFTSNHPSLHLTLTNIQSSRSSSVKARVYGDVREAGSF